MNMFRVAGLVALTALLAVGAAYVVRTAPAENSFGEVLWEASDQVSNREVGFEASEPATIRVIVKSSAIRHGARRIKFRFMANSLHNFHVARPSIARIQFDPIIAPAPVVHAEPPQDNAKVLAAGENLLENSSFETWNGAYPAAWKLSGPTAKITDVTTAPKDGAHAVLVTDGVLWQQFDNAAPFRGRTLVFGVWAKDPKSELTLEIDDGTRSVRASSADTRARSGKGLAGVFAREPRGFELFTVSMPISATAESVAVRCHLVHTPIEMDAAAVVATGTPAPKPQPVVRQTGIVGNSWSWVRFGGRDETTIGAQGFIDSDPVDYDFKPGESYYVTYFAGPRLTAAAFRENRRVLHGYRAAAVDLSTAQNWESDAPRGAAITPVGDILGLAAILEAR